MAHLPVLFSGLPACEDGNQSLYFHELATSIQLLQLKAPPSSSFSISTPSPLPPRKSTICLPSKNSVGSTVISIAGKDGRNGLMVWSSLNNKPTPAMKLIPPGRVVTISLSSSGIYLAAGSNDGTVMLWELSTGTLLASFDAHYKSITCLSFSDDDAALITASEDSMCSVWSIPALVDEGANSNLSYAPYVSLSDHTLPISDVHVSHGIFPDIRIFTASLDQTVKIWTPLYPSCPLLSTFAIPGPAHHIAVDPLERFIFVSYPITTSAPTPAALGPLKSGISPSHLTSSASNFSASTIRAIPLFSRPAHSATHGGASLVHASNGFIHPSASTDSVESVYTSPQATTITALHLPSAICSSRMLLCGLSNGKIMHLSLPSLQPLGTTIPRPASSDPVICLHVFLRPPDLMMNYSGKAPGTTSGASNGSSSQQLIPSRPVGMLGRAVGKTGDPSRAQSDKNGHGSDQSSLRDRRVILKLGRTLNSSGDRGSEGKEDDPFSLPDENPISFNTHSVKAKETVPTRLEPLASSNTAETITRLEGELSKVRDQLGQALQLNDTMWNGIVEGTLKLNHHPTSEDT